MPGVFPPSAALTSDAIIHSGGEGGEKDRVANNRNSNWNLGEEER